MRAARQEQAEEKDKLQEVFAGLQKLPEIDRAALLMRAFDEMPYEELAPDLGILLASVKVKINS
jgi:RNA polymerase sigma-70 factor (ECF subfamily)